MKIKRKEMLGHLEKVLPGVESGSSLLEGADTFVFTQDGIYSYNDSISVSIPVETGITGAVKSKEFYNLLKKLKDDTVTIIQKKDNLMIRCGNTRATIKLVKSSIMEYLDNLDMDSLKWKDIEESFKPSLALCKLNVSNSPYRGIFVDQDVMYSTDEIRIAVAHLKGKYPTFWIDDPSVAELLKLRTPLSKIAIAPGWVHFTGEDGTIFSCKTNDASQYPFDALMNIKVSCRKKKTDPSGKLPDTFQESVDRVSVLSEDIQGFSVVNLAFTPTELVLSSHRQAGSIEESIPWEKELKIKKGLETSGDSGFLIEACSKSYDFYITENEGSEYIVFTSDRFVLLLSTIK